MLLRAVGKKTTNEILSFKEPTSDSTGVCSVKFEGALE